MHPPFQKGRNQPHKTFATTVVEPDTGLHPVQKKATKETTIVQNEVDSFVDTNLCLNCYEYENETVNVHNVKGRLRKNIHFWKEKLLLAESSKKLSFAYFRIWLSS